MQRLTRAHLLLLSSGMSGFARIRTPFLATAPLKLGLRLFSWLVENLRLLFIHSLN